MHAVRKTVNEWPGSPTEESPIVQCNPLPNPGTQEFQVHGLPSLRLSRHSLGTQLCTSGPGPLLWETVGQSCAHWPASAHRLMEADGSGPRRWEPRPSGQVRLTAPAGGSGIPRADRAHAPVLSNSHSPCLDQFAFYLQPRESSLSFKTQLRFHAPGRPPQYPRIRLFPPLVIATCRLHFDFTVI